MKRKKSIKLRQAVSLFVIFTIMSPYFSYGTGFDLREYRQEFTRYQEFSRKQDDMGVAKRILGEGVEYLLKKAQYELQVRERLEENPTLVELYSLLNQDKEKALAGLAALKEVRETFAKGQEGMVKLQDEVIKKTQETIAKYYESGQEKEGIAKVFFSYLKGKEAELAQSYQGLVKESEKKISLRQYDEELEKAIQAVYMGYSREYAQVTRLASNRLVVGIFSDMISAKSMSEGQSASNMVAEELLKRKENLGRTEAEIFNKLKEPALNQVESLETEGELSREIRESLEQGLGYFNEVREEIRLDFQRRLSEGKIYYQEGAREWESAMNELEGKRQSWLVGIYERINEGTAGWAKKDQDLAQEYNNLKQRLAGYLSEKQEEFAAYSLAVSNQLQGASGMFANLARELDWVKSQQNARELSFKSKLQESKASLLADFISYDTPQRQAQKAYVSCETLEQCYAISPGSWYELMDLATNAQGQKVLDIRIRTRTITSARYCDAFLRQCGGTEDIFAQVSVTTGYEDTLTSLSLDGEGLKDFFGKLKNDPANVLVRLLQEIQIYSEEEAKIKSLKSRVENEFSNISGAYYRESLHGHNQSDGILSYDSPDGSDLYLMSQAELAYEEKKRVYQYWVKREIVAKAVVEYALGDKDSAYNTEQALRQSQEKLLLERYRYEKMLGANSLSREMLLSKGISLERIKEVENSVAVSLKSFEDGSYGVEVLDDQGNLVKKSLLSLGEGLVSLNDSLSLGQKELEDAELAYQNKVRELLSASNPGVREGFKRKAQESFAQFVLSNMEYEKQLSNIKAGRQEEALSYLQELIGYEQGKGTLEETIALQRRIAKLETLGVKRGEITRESLSYLTKADVVNPKTEQQMQKTREFLEQTGLELEWVQGNYDGKFYEIVNAAGSLLENLYYELDYHQQILNYVYGKSRNENPDENLALALLRKGQLSQESAKSKAIALIENALQSGKQELAARNIELVNQILKEDFASGIKTALQKVKARIAEGEYFVLSEVFAGITEILGVITYTDEERLLQSFRDKDFAENYDEVMSFFRGKRPCGSGISRPGKSPGKTLEKHKKHQCL